jgi:hypothetical protein
VHLGEPIPSLPPQRHPTELLLGQRHLKAARAIADAGFQRLAQRQILSPELSSDVKVEEPFMQSTFTVLSIKRRAKLSTRHSTYNKSCIVNA